MCTGRYRPWSPNRKGEVFKSNTISAEWTINLTSALSDPENDLGKGGCMNGDMMAGMASVRRVGKGGEVGMAF